MAWTTKIGIFILVSFSLLHGSLGMVPVRDLMEPSTQFFRTPESSFPSGDATIHLLMERKINSRMEVWFWVDSGGNKDWVAAQNLYFLRDFYLQNPSEQTGILTNNVQTLRYSKGWRPGEKLKKGTYVTIHSVRSDWSCGVDQKGRLCVPTNQVILALDTARRVQSINGRWYDVKYRMGHIVMTQKNQRILVSRIKSWEADPEVGFLRTTGSVTENKNPTLAILAPFEKVQILKKELRRWHQSILPEHGNVWWQDPQRTNLYSPTTLISKQELFNRTLFDKSQGLKLSILSANGIFISENGQDWTHLKQFGDENFPVTIGPRNTLIVGDQISFDYGKSFQNYLRWDQIALQTQIILKHPPKHLRIKSVRPRGSSRLQVNIDTGYKTLAFEFNAINSQVQFLHADKVRP